MLFHDLWDYDHVVAFRRSILQHLVNGKPGSRDVFLPDVVKGERVSGGLDSRHVDLRQLLNVVEYVSQLLRKHRLLSWRQCKPREFRDVVNVEIGRRGHVYFLTK